MVILVHSRQRIDGLSPIFKVLNFGQMGCQIFFVVSGYLAANSLYKNRIAIGFWKRRFASIAPGCYVMIVVTQVINAILRHWSFDLGFAENSGVISILCNMAFLQGILPFCNNNVIGGGWYIGTTAIFYAMSPYIYVFLKKTKHRIWGSDFFNGSNNYFCGIRLLDYA